MSQKQTLQLIYLKFINVAKVSCATNQDTSYCIPNKSEKNKILHLLSKSRPTLLSYRDHINIFHTQSSELNFSHCKMTAPA